jgi:hypothetical protein
MPTSSAIDIAVQRMLAEQLCSQLAKTALPGDQQAGAYSSMFAQVLADAIAPEDTTTTTPAKSTHGAAEATA